MIRINSCVNKGSIAVVISLIMFILSGCSSKPTGRYSIEHDHGPSTLKDMSHVPDAVPKLEPRSRGGNKSPYRVLGKTYYVLGSSDGYRERGGASWYGKKFHGHKTSNGEIYDMYQMTAAHKSLPIPTYVKVTNLDNGRQVIVRVNDRGPFHAGRIIDLSYAAAFKLGMLSKGTARVEVEAINPRSWRQSEQVREVGTKKTLSSGQYVQVGAYSSIISAERVVSRLSRSTGQSVKIIQIERQGRTLHRVVVGPINDAGSRELIVRQITENGFPDAHLVDLP